MRLEPVRASDSASCADLLRDATRTLRGSERIAAQYIARHVRDIVYLPITELAERTGVSEATISRLCQRLGFRGYQDLKIRLALECVSPLQNLHEEINEEDTLVTATRKAFFSAVNTLESTLQHLSFPDMERAVEALDKAARVFVFGVGGSGSVALDAAHKFMKVGVHCICHTDPHMQSMQASLADPECVALGISHSGSTKDIVDALTLARDAGATTIAITSPAKSPIDRVTDIKLCTASRELYFKIESSASRLGQLLIIDGLTLGLALRRREQTLENIQKTRRAIAPKRY